MPLPRTAVALLASWTLAIQSVQAQSSHDRAPIEATVSFGTFTLAAPLTLGFRVTVPHSQRRAFELGVDWLDLGRRERSPDQLVFYYFVGGRQWLRQAAQVGDGRVFVTYGVGGWVERSIDVAGFYQTVIPPVFPALGVGAERSVGRRARLRWDAQTVWMWAGEAGGLAPRLSVGVSFPVRSEPAPP